MPLSFAEKEAVVAEISEVAANAYSAVAAEYSGMAVGELTELRAEARKAGVFLRVVKNSLARRAVEGTDFACMQDGLTGQLILAFSQEDPGAAARVINDFSKDHKNLVVKLVSIGGKLLDPSEISTLAKMPTYDQAISLLMAVMKAPVEKLTRTINEVPGKLVRTVAAIRDAKEAA
ncbi:MAG: 50S ribosomal protein L10 [Candidatus Polarisedimenticolaceae bacterium]|nr:50S ribosomal protein L10 [Candidatus Polarisedimenticolaceae bacterium]